jgi:general stress protein YciG
MTDNKKSQNDQTDNAAIITAADTSRGQQGFASMSKEKQREIASKGGKAAHQQGTAHEWTSKEAAEAGRRGGQNRSTSSTKISNE